MKYLSNIIYISILSIFALLIKSSNTQNITIQILLDKPDVINMSNWKNYSTLLDEYLLNLSSNNDTAHVYFTYNTNEIVNKKDMKDYTNYVDYIINEFKTSTIDMMILDEKVLFGNIANIESSYVEDTFKQRKFYKFLLDMTDHIKKEDLSFHDQEILKKGYLDDHLYALPYEVDFDLFYYNINNDEGDQGNKGDSVLNFEQKSWSDILSMQNKSFSKSKNPLGLGLGSDDELLNMFTEYMSSDYNILDNIEENFKLFYNDQSNELFNSFKEFIKKSSPTLNMEQFLNLTPEDAYNSFINEGNTFFKGKASHYNYFVQNNSTNSNLMLLPPKNFSVKNKKFLVINANSKIDTKVLTDIALKLTSKEMQLFRAEKFGSIPTFDFSQNSKDASLVESYCTGKLELCNLIRKMKSIDLKDFFNGEYNSPFMEVRLLLPKNLKKYLLENNNETKKITTIFDNIKNLIIDQWSNRNSTKLLIYLPMALFTICSIAIMFLVYKNRNHPYLKPFSPDLCLLIISGFILRIISPQFSVQNNNTLICHVSYIYDTIETDLVVFSMFAITYRIYIIYTGNTRFNFSKVLNNKNLFKFIIIAIGFMIILSASTTFIFKSYIVSSGNIETYRHPICKFDSGFDYSIIERWINRFVVSKN